MEKLIRQLTKESRTYLDSVKKMLDACTSFASEYSALFHPFGNEYDLERRHPETVQTLVNLTGYVAYIDDLRETLRPEIELISTRIIAPTEELEKFLKSIEKAITKRDHKLIDFDRHTNSYNKLKEKQNRSAKEDQSMFKLEHDCEAAAADYEHHNNLLKQELPQFLAMATRFVTPLFYSFYYMQLNIFYLSMDKLKAYANGKFDLSENNLISHEHKFAMDMSHIIAELESFSIQKPVPPSARIMQMARAGQSLSTRPRGQTVQGEKGKAAVAAAAVPATATAASSSVPPPAYSPSTAGVTAAAGKPSAMSADYVVALYDYTATADGDLSFKAGDRIEVLQRTPSTEDWWTGRLNGVQGVFPGNYVREDA
ncbi:BAR adaptor protein Hob1 [Malassezia pachydermatis]